MTTLIQRTPGVCGGEACIGMTRIAVWMPALRVVSPKEFLQALKSQNP